MHTIKKSAYHFITLFGSLLRKQYNNITNQNIFLLAINHLLTAGSSTFPVLSNKEKVARVGLLRQRTPTECVRDNFGGNILSCPFALVWCPINTIAEHYKCGRADSQYQLLRFTLFETASESVLKHITPNRI